MRIRSPRRFDLLMAKPLRDHQDIESHLNEQRSGRVSEVMHTDRIKPGKAGNPFDLIQEIILPKIEDPLIRRISI